MKKLERLQTPRRRRLVNKLQAIEKKKLALDESDRRCAIMLNNANELAVACFRIFNELIRKLHEIDLKMQINSE